LSNIPLKSILAKNIKEIRSAKGLRQEDLAEKSGYSVAFIGMLEAELRNASFKTIERIAEAFEVEPARLFAVKTAPKSPASKGKEGIKVLFYEFVRDALEEIADNAPDDTQA
jgi:transcriptional regulator with XRE-family HTH domain